MVRRAAGRALVIGVFLALCVLTLGGASAGTSAEWPTYAGTNASLRYSTLDQINRNTVGRLRVAWQQQATPVELQQGRPAPPALTNYQNTPLMIGNLLYISSG